MFVKLPSNLLRSLGTTSKLLGEAIGERITFKAKGAKKRLDRNFKSSTEAISNIGVDAGRSLKHASKRFGSNFSLGRNKDKADIGIGGRPGGSGEMDLDRRQTMPSTEVFNTIQFSSPLNRNGGLPDLRENDAKLQKEDYLRPDPDQEDDGCYEVPKTQGKPPSYDEALRSRPSPSDSPMSRNLAQEAAQLVQLRNQRQLSSSSSNGDESPRLPMPAFPPPRLSQQPEQFRMDALQPPVRQKRRKNYEHIELRRPPVDSAQLEELNRAAAAAEREESLLISAKNAEAETKTPKPERSDSWEFYGEDENEEEDRDEEQEGSSSPEPLYANQEATYGKLFEMATAGSSRSNVLTPNQVAEQQQLACITEDSELDACEGAVGGVPLPQAVIEEFDPLSSKCSTLARSNKSNELLLLEHLLEEDTYGTVKAEQDDVSMCTSEEEPTTSAATSPKPQQPQIVHQNARLLSDSMENMLDSDQERAKPYLSRMPESANKVSGPVDLASASRNRTNWFVPDKASCSDVTPNTSKTTPPIEGDSPPTYLEAIGGSKDAAGNQENRSTIGSRFRQTINCAEKKLPSSGQNKLILQENNSDSQQPIYGPDANENVQEPVYATPRPAPRQRLPPAGEPEDSYPDPDDEVPLRILRAAPQIPPKPLNILLDQRSSICSEVSTTSVQTPGKADEDREGSRYASNASLDCSESSHSGKFKSQSPGYVDAVDSSIPQSDHPDPNGHHPQAESSSAEQSSGSQDGDDDK